MADTSSDVAGFISDKTVTAIQQTWVNGKWVNLADTNQRNNMQVTLNKVGKTVTEQQAGIADAQGVASSAMSSASAAIESSKVNSQAIVDVNSATSEAKSDVAVVATTASETSANLKTTQGDITSLKASASQASLVIADNKKNVASVTATVDGLQTTIAGKVNTTDYNSKVTQLSNLIDGRVSTADYKAEVAVLATDIDLKVAKGDVVSQINQEAGGNTLIQVASGKGKLYLDAASTIFSGTAFIPGAAITELDADKLTFYGNGAKASIGASIVQYDDDKAKSTINLQYDGGIEIHSSSQQGSILTMHDNTIRLASKSWGDNSNPYQYSGFYAAPNYSLMNTYHKDGTTSGVAIDNDRIWIYGDSKDQQLGALQADVGWYSINGKTGLLTGDQITLKSGNTQAVLTDNNININNTSDTNSKNYDVGIHIKGWAEMTGWFTCMGLTQTSLLSKKTNIKSLDSATALDVINSTGIYEYQFKSDVETDGANVKHHYSPIIDDVNDTPQYETPNQFIAENKQGRDDGDILGYVVASIQELSKQVDTLKQQLSTK